MEQGGNMSQVSKRVLDKDVSEKIKENFWEVLGNLKDKEETQQFIYDFLTATEQIMLQKRLAIVFMVYQGYSHRDISEALKVSTTTVSFVIAWMRYEGKGYRQTLSRLLKKEKIKAIWYKIDDFLQHPIVKNLYSKESLREFYKKKYQNKPRETPLGYVIGDRK